MYSKDLTFKKLREANLDRLPQFRDKRGVICHANSDGSDWSPSDWMTAVSGEVGELASEIKALRRGDYAGIERSFITKKVAHEAADIVIYLDLLVSQFGIDLGEAITEKFNIVSERVHATTKL